MKKRIIGAFLCIMCLFFNGCGKYGEKDLVKDFSKKIEGTDSYSIIGTLNIVNNDETYSYDVNVSYQKENKFRVSLKNKINNYEQIILRNSDGVFVLTPSLNKSFKFQSEWPYNSSQSYLLQTILEDIQNDDKRNYEANSDGYIITTKANYSSNKALTNQKIYFDKNQNIYKVEVLDNNNNVKMIMDIATIDYNANFSNDYFDLNKNISVSNIDTQTNKTIDQIIYPMYMPENTYLSSQDKVVKEDGERIIMTFGGDSSFMLIQETITVSDKIDIIPVNGEPHLLVDSIGTISENSIEWVGANAEYYLVSDTMSKDDLIQIARSLSVMPVGK